MKMIHRGGPYYEVQGVPANVTITLKLFDGRHLTVETTPQGSLDLNVRFGDSRQPITVYDAITGDEITELRPKEVFNE